MKAAVIALSLAVVFLCAAYWQLSKRIDEVSQEVRETMYLHIEMEHE